MQIETWRDETFDIADDSSKDYLWRGGRWVFNPDNIRRAELRIKQLNCLCRRIKAKHVERARTTSLLPGGTVTAIVQQLIATGENAHAG